MSRTFSKQGFYFEKKKKKTKLMSARNIYFSGSSLSNEIYTQREKMNGILGLYIVVLLYNKMCYIKK